MKTKGLEMDYDSLTWIAAILGAFFVSVALFKNLGRRNGDRSGAAGAAFSKSASEEVKLSDPFAAPKTPEAKKAKVPAFVTDALPEASDAAAGKSMFKQFSPHVSGSDVEQVKDDNDYHWE